MMDPLLTLKQLLVRAQTVKSYLHLDMDESALEEVRGMEELLKDRIEELELDRSIPSIPEVTGHPDPKGWKDPEQLTLPWFKGIGEPDEA